MNGNIFPRNLWRSLCYTVFETEKPKFNHIKFDCNSLALFITEKLIVLRYSKDLTTQELLTTTEAVNATFPTIKAPFLLESARDLLIQQLARRKKIALHTHCRSQLDLSGCEDVGNDYMMTVLEKTFYI